MSDIRFVKKIGAGTLGYDKKALRELCAKKPAKVFKVYGLATNVRYGTHNENGDWTKFLGQFEAVDLGTGEVVRSGELFLPSSVTPILESQIISGKGDEEVQFKGIQFAMEVGVEHNAKAATEYVFTCKDLMPKQENDFLSSMRSEFVANKELAKA